MGISTPAESSAALASGRAPRTVKPALGRPAKPTPIAASRVR